MDAARLLAIPLDRPDRLFAGFATEDQTLYRKLAAQWHPDRNPGNATAANVFAHVSSLWTERNRRVAAGTWSGAGVDSLPRADGTMLTIRYLTKRPFELGTMYMSKTTLFYAVETQHRALLDRAVTTIKSLRYADEKMEKMFALTFPVFKDVVETVQGPVLVLDKTEDVFPLRDVVEAAGGRLAAKHAAWVMTRLHSLTCYLQWAGLVHNDMELDSVFVSPTHHSVLLLGGWWYTTTRMAPLTVLPSKAAEAWRSLPSSVTAAKKARTRLDRTMIRSVVREAMGDPAGTRLLRDPEVPAAMSQWLTLPAGKDAVADYAAWAGIRDTVFPRRFETLDVSASDIYAPVGA